MLSFFLSFLLCSRFVSIGFVHMICSHINLLFDSFYVPSVVPADTQWLKGDVVQVDTAPLTGEPIPRKYPGDHGDIILSGTTVVAGECYGRVMRTGSNTEIGQAQADVLKDKTVRIVSVFQKKIMTVVQVLVSTSLVIVLAVLLVEGLKYDGFADSESVQKTILDAVSCLSSPLNFSRPMYLTSDVSSFIYPYQLACNHDCIYTDCSSTSPPS